MNDRDVVGGYRLPLRERLELTEHVVRGVVIAGHAMSVAEQPQGPGNPEASYSVI